MLYRDQIALLRAIHKKQLAGFNEVARAVRPYRISHDAAYVYLGRLRKRGLIDTTYRQKASSRFAIYSLTMLGRRAVAAWELLQSISPTGWPYGKKRSRRRKAAA